MIQHNNTNYYLVWDEDSQQKYLCIEGDTASFAGELLSGVFRCPLTPENAAALRKRLPWLQPQPLGLNTSFGFGDRLGLATPGHIAAVQGTGIAPVFAQQSVRENARTGRTPQIVLDDAMWALFEADWRSPWGADADHVKEISDLPPFITAEYSFYTIDPNEYVDNEAHTDSVETLKTKVKALPWDELGISWDGLVQLYGAASIQLDGITLEFQEETLLRAAAKYGQAVAHIKAVSDYLVENLGQFDLEASVDETDTPTSVAEHYYIANELRRLGVPFVSLAPRFIGSFEKGVDYVGDIAEFERELEKHAAVMHAIGGYKISIHTGSDKFSIYSSIAEQARNLVHVKTAGTSYLEALRVIETVDHIFFREILDFSRSRYQTDRATYHVSGVLDKVPAAAALGNEELLALFEQFDARQVLHVTFGSVLDDYGSRLKETLVANLALYERYLQKHFNRHLEPFVNETINTPNDN
jgi:tagaturonate epimerase